MFSREVLLVNSQVAEEDDEVPVKKKRKMSKSAGNWRKGGKITKSDRNRNIQHVAEVTYSLCLNSWAGSL